MPKVCGLASDVEEQLLERNQIFEKFFAREARSLALACREMSERFLKGGRLLAFGRGSYATDAQHVSVEFVHPIIVGKRALPALDLSILFRPWLDAILRPEDIVMGFGPPEGDPEIEDALESARARQAMTFALPGHKGSYALESPVTDPFIHQELIEILYHTLWETVHVFFEHRELGHDVGDAAFLYPFLGEQKQQTGELVDQVAASIQAKVREDTELRARAAREEAEPIVNAAQAIHERLARGGKLIVFGNGGSATDANDFALDCVAPPQGYRPIPAVSLAMEPANITAIANDVGLDVVFMRQMIAHARPEDIAVGISTSGGSRNIVMALEEARKRKLLTVALLGYDGGAILRGGLADFPLVVRSDYIPRIQEVQASMYHVLRNTLQSLGEAGLHPATDLQSASGSGGKTSKADTIGLQDAILPHKYELFGTSSCQYTEEMRDWLEWKGHEYVEYDVESDHKARARMQVLTGGQRTVPVLVEDGKVTQIGWQGRGCVVDRA